MIIKGYFMKKIRSSVLSGMLLVVISLLIYSIQLIQFNTPRDTVFYFLQDLAFLPLQIAIVTIVLNRIISSREKRDRLKKMNMAISAFFGEAGTDMLDKLSQFNASFEKIKCNLVISGKWANKDFQNAVKMINGCDFIIDSRVGNLDELKEMMLEKRYFMLSMLENPNLLEHDTFTDMLWAVFHLMDELVAREGFTDLPDTDLNHLSSDMKRAFTTLLVEWVNYIAHLKTDYPYLFSMAIRKNPFNDNASAIIR